MSKVFLCCFLCSISLITYGQEQANDRLQKTYINPANGYTQVVAVITGKVKTLYISGQVGEGEDLESQVRSAFDHLEKQLSDAGASLTDVVKMNTYIVDYQPAHLEIFKRIRKQRLGDQHLPASTIVGVQALALKEFLVEIEAVALVSVE